MKFVGILVYISPNKHIFVCNFEKYTHFAQTFPRNNAFCMLFSPFYVHLSLFCAHWLGPIGCTGKFGELLISKDQFLYCFRNCELGTGKFKMQAPLLNTWPWSCKDLSLG